MTILTQYDADRQAAMNADIYTDAAAGQQLITEMAYELAMIAYECAGAPADFAQGLVDVANGAHYCADGIDWYAVEREEWR